MKDVKAASEDNVFSLHTTSFGTGGGQVKRILWDSFETDVDHQEGFGWPAVRLETTLSNASLLRRFSVMLLLSSNFGRMTAMYPSVDG